MHEEVAVVLVGIHCQNISYVS